MRGHLRCDQQCAACEPLASARFLVTSTDTARGTGAATELLVYQ